MKSALVGGFVDSSRDARIERACRAGVRAGGRPPDHGTDDQPAAGAAATKTIATRDARASGAGKGAILDELCATMGWHRNHARKALVLALGPRVLRPRRPRAPKYGPDVVAALAFCWAVLGAPTGKRLAPVMGELVPTLRRFGEIDVSDARAALLVAMSPATMDRRLAPDRAKLAVRGRSHTKPGSLLKDSHTVFCFTRSVHGDC